MAPHQTAPVLSVGIGGLGAIGAFVARAIDQGIPGLKLEAVSANSKEKARKTLSRLAATPRFCSLQELADYCDLVIECAPAAVYDEIARPAIEAGRIFMTMSTGALMARPELMERARNTGSRIIIPSGGIAGLDAFRAAAEGEIHSVTLITRKPAMSLAGAPHLARNNIELDNLSAPLKVFDGNASDAAQGFPANANVAATLSLAGIGALRTRVEIWADPGIERNTQEVIVSSDSADFRLVLSSYPLAENPRTGSLTPRSVVAALRALTSNLTFAH